MPRSEQVSCAASARPCEEALLSLAASVSFVHPVPVLIRPERTWTTTPIGFMQPVPLLKSRRTSSSCESPLRPTGRTGSGRRLQSLP
ncbi:hypothetical protein BV25DRAFT_144046 [Artomyces pyxidatus]|uniref:Uncharacterized protein n=1 Tax=Artomyces pyxidatus TaxID=48021 RepID=A0ACB8TAJ6_9AGAM|nr:hypothetical protein BV25DRAFT_144046 [Artomyces pyxidatus]